MAGKSKKVMKIRMVSTGSTDFYTTTKPRGFPQKLERKRYDPIIRQVALYKEAKI